MISLLISGYSFGSYESMLQNKKALKLAIDGHYSNRNNSVYWGLLQGFFAHAFIKVVAMDQRKGHGDERAAMAILAPVLATSACFNLINIIDQQRKINRDDQELSNLQKQLDALVPENPGTQQSLSEKVLALQKELEKVEAGLLQK